MARQAMRMGIAAAAVAFLAAGSAALAEGGTRIVEDRKLEPGGKLILEADAGSVDLKGGSGSGAHIVITSDYDDLKEKFDFKYEETAGQLRIVAKKKGAEGWLHWNSSTHAPNFEIHVPSRTTLSIQTGGGHIEVDTIQGNADLHTSGGHVQVSDLQGTLTVETSGGHITLKDITGDSSVETSGGHIEANSLRGKLHAETSGGHISLKDVSGDIDASTSGGHITITGAGGRVKAETSGGHVEVAFARGNARGGDIESSGGGVTVTVDPSLGFSVDAETGGGSVNSDVPITIEGRQSRSSLKGTIGRGGEVLHIRTSAGSISIEKL